MSPARQTDLQTTDGVSQCNRTVLYMVLKISLVWERGQQLVISAKAVAQAQATFGKSVTPAELCEVGAQCSICQASAWGKTKPSVRPGLHLSPRSCAREH